jgi:hypothetical protein
MKPGLGELDSIVVDTVDDSVLLRQSSRPNIEAQVLEWLRLPDPGERIAHDALHQADEARDHARLGLSPLAELFEEEGVDDDGARLAC